MIQRQLFEPTLIKSASLIAPDSPRQGFYKMGLPIHSESATRQI